MSIKSDSPLYKYVVGFIHHSWGSKEYFPGPQPISVEYKHFPIIKKGDYVVCEKTDGERYMMVALYFEGKKKCIFVNRAFNMFQVPINLGKMHTMGQFWTVNSTKIPYLCMMLSP